MEEIRYRIRAWGTRLFMLALLIAAGVIAGCATTSTVVARGKTIWKQSEQFVKIEQQDYPADGKITANAHPVDIPINRLRSMLESIEVSYTGESKKIQLFNEDELEILSENIHTGLDSAGSGEDVTFAIIGHYVSLMGFLKERMVTTGRVFCRDGELNIIFGEVHRPVKENEDRRLYPLLPGLRGAASRQEWRLVAKPGTENFTMKRPDWVIYPIAGIAVPVAVPVPPQGSGSTGTVKKAVIPSEPREKPVTVGKKSIEERLMILNDLRNKKLITEEEYRAKRLEILNEL